MLRRVFTRSAITNHIAKSLAAALVPGTILLASLQPQRAEALVLFTIREINGKVEVTTSGTYSTDGLTIDPTPVSIQFPAINPGLGYLLAGTDNSNVYLAELDNPPLSGLQQGFGSILQNDLAGITTGATQGSAFGFYADPAQPLIYLPTDTLCDVNNYCSITTLDINNNPIKTVFNSTYEQLGLSPGTFTWSWGGDETQQIQLTIEPVPAPLPLLGGAAAFGWSRRLRRRVRAAKLTSLTEARA